MPVTISGTDGISIDGDPVATDADLSALVTGKVLQVVQTTKKDTFSTTSGSYTPVTGLSVNITPSSASNKILLLAHLTVNVSSGGNHGLGWRFYGGNSDTYDSDVHGAVYRSASGSLSYPSPVPGMYLDSPNTTSPITYGINVKYVWAAATVYVNRSADTNWGSGVSSITAMEIAA